MDSGQCDCRGHLIGRQCSEVQPGYFCAPLDYYKYEAEEAAGRSPTDTSLPGQVRPQAAEDCIQHLSNQARRHRRHRRISSLQQSQAALRRIRQLQQTPDVTTVHRERTPNHIASWTGPGFARVKDGAGLVFIIDNIPYAMEYDIVIRYEPESTEDWEAVVSITSAELPSSLRCGNLLPAEQLYTETLLHHNRYILMSRPFCFEPSNRYVISIRFQRHSVAYRHLTAFILIDSLILIPKYTELPGFRVNDPDAEQHREDMIRYMCLDSFMITPMTALAEMCSKLICSISASIHDGALPCQCDPQGSISGECYKVGGQCRCKANVIGRRCEQCAPGTYGFGVNGCSACDCHPEGSFGHQCDPVTGQCPCRQGVTGRQCSDCQPGQWGFPSCRPCQCNGHAELCDPQTGECRDCRDSTAGHFCERCMDGFHGNPVLGSGDHCHPCPCPGNPGSNHFNGHSCQTDDSANQIICNCQQGYTGYRCDQCAPGYYGNPEQPGGQCLPCECNDNIDPQDPGSCDPRTGRCLRCLYHTDGPSCAECEIGYYGNALIKDCRRCVCVSAGTLVSACSDGQCLCDRNTGACPCREFVIGDSCDQCAPDHWNYGHAEGCQPCNCDQQNALGDHCNMFTGQCYCRPGFGGQHCTECQEYHWGDPQVECKECSCHPMGSQTAQCNRETGQCECQEGMAGARCDECARGFTGVFPNCVRCHQCFQLWDDYLCQIRRDLDHIQYTVQRILESGITPGVGSNRIKELEQKLNQVRKLIDAGDTERIHQLIGQSIDDLSTEILLTNQRLAEIGQDINKTKGTDEVLKRNLTDMERELRDVNATLAHHQEQLDNYLTSGFADQFDKVKKYYQESQKAEEKCNASVSGPANPVDQSNQTRGIVEALLDATTDELLQNLTVQNNSLNELHQNAQNLSEKVQRLSKQVCGGPNETSQNGSCSNNTCGCQDDQGNLVCGGKGCDGTKSFSLTVLNNARNVTDRMKAAMEELQDVAKRLQDIASQTQDVKKRTMNALEKAQKKKEYFEKSNKDLKDFIKTIKDFLTEEGADPESIQKIAEQVLDIKLPLNRTTLDKITMQIKDSIANLSNVQGIMNQTSQLIRSAEDLLNKAKDAETEAVSVRDLVNNTKQALNVSETAIEKAKGALKVAQDNLSGTKNATAEVEEGLREVVDKQMDIMMRLTNLSKGVEALKNKTEMNRQMAKDAVNLANNATHQASTLERRLNETEKRYRELQLKMESLGGDSGNLNSIHQKVKDMKKDAEDLLSKAKNGIQDLDKLGEVLKSNEERMRKQLEELEDLKQNATVVRDDIQKDMKIYSNCQG